MTSIDDVTIAAEAYAADSVAVAVAEQQAAAQAVLAAANGTITALNTQLDDARSALATATADDATDDATISVLSSQVAALQVQLAAATQPPAAPLTAFPKSRGTLVQLPVGIIEITDLLEALWTTGGGGGYGAYLQAATKRFVGAGIDNTLIRVKPGSITKALALTAALNASGKGTNNFAALRIGEKQTGFEAGNFTLDGGGLVDVMNGLTAYMTTRSLYHEFRVQNFGGSKSVPPWEIFGVNDWQGNNNTYRGMEIDGGGKGASGFGANKSINPIIIGGSSVGNPNGAGYTHYRTQGAEHYGDVVDGAKAAFNFEMGGNAPYILDHPEMRNISGHEFIFDSTDASAKIVIREPKTDRPDGTFRSLIHAKYVDNGTSYPVVQKAADITLIKDGVVRNDLLIFSGN